MKTLTPLSSPSQRGALMGIVLLVMLVSGLFITAWVSLMSTRATQVSYLENAVQRRIAVENSRLLSWESAMMNAFQPASTLQSTTGLLQSGTAGGVTTLDGWANLNLYTSTQSPLTMTTVFPYNYTGLRPGNAYLSHDWLGRPSSLTAVDNFTSHLFLKSYPPVLAGDLFTIYRKPDRATSEIDVYQNTASSQAIWQVKGRTVVRDPASLFVVTTSRVRLPFQTNSLYIQAHDPSNRTPITGTGPNDAELLPSNLPAMPTSSGPVSDTDDESFDGYLNVVRNDDNPDNSLWHFMEREKLTGLGDYKTIDVYTKSAVQSGPYWMAEYSGVGADMPPHPPPAYPAGYPTQFKTLYVQLNNPLLTHLRITNVINQIVFIGQNTSLTYEAAGALSPLIITLVQNDQQPVGNITFQHENNRRIILGVKHPSGQKLDLSWVGDSILGSELRWRMTFINEYQTVWLDLHKNATLRVRWIGGVMTNWFFKRYTSTGPRSDRLTFESDASVATLPVVGSTYASLLPRDAWLENFFLPTQP